MRLLLAPFRAVARLFRRRWVRWSALAAVAAIAVAARLVYVTVQGQGGPIYRSVAAAPAMPVAVVFGAGYSTPDGKPSSMLFDRVRTAVELYKAHKVRKLLMTGDNSRVGYNEPAVMLHTAVQLGVPARDVVLDYAGFRTYDSVYRAKEIFGVTDAVFVTQAYHLPRALYTAKRLGMTAVGVAADRPEGYPYQRGRDFREVLSIESAWLETNLWRKPPHFLGKKEPIFAADPAPGGKAAETAADVR